MASNDDICIVNAECSESDELDGDYLLEQCLAAFQDANYTEAVRLLLLAERSKFDHQTGRLMQLLQLAIKNEWLNVAVKYLITKYGCDPMVADDDGTTCLHLAVWNNHIDIVWYLITEHGCDPTVADNDGHTCLHIAVWNNHIDIVIYLITALACDPMVADNDGRTCLHLAVWNNHIDIVIYLTEHGCDPMFVDNDGRTCLHIAVQKNHIDIVKYLITKHGYDPVAADVSCWSCLHLAVVCNHIDIMKYLITECNCDPMVADNYGRTCLHLAVINNHTDIIKYLITECDCGPMVADNYGRTYLHLAVRNNHIDIVKYLITECDCDPMVADNYGRTCLHLAVRNNHIDIVKYLITEHGCDPMVADNDGHTCLNYDMVNHEIFSMLTKIDDVKKFNPVDSYVNVLLLGQSGAGKSTLAQVIIKRAIGTSFLGLVRNVSGVDPFTAGVIPTAVHQHKEFGNIILHDFAGHPEYYSSHTAVIENLLQGAGAVFIVVVDITKEDSTKHLQQWLTVVSNEVYKCIRQCHIIVAVSHIDEMTDASIKNKRLKEFSDIIMVKCGFDVSLKCLDCRKLGGGNINSLVNVLSKCCQSIRSANQNHLGIYCHLMYGFLKNDPKNVLSLSDIVNSPLRDEYFLSKNEEKIIEILSLLHMVGLICLVLSINTSKVWVVVNKQILLAEVNGILFAPKSFKQYNRNIASNTGIITSSSLVHLFPHYDPDMLICFFLNMALCEEITSQLLTMTNLKALKEDDKLLFFPALLNIDRPHDITGRVFKFGWCLQCNEEYFFPPRFFHILMLKLAYKFGLPKHSSHLPIINRQCTFWSNGIHWCNGEGVETLVEMVDESQCVLVLMSYQAGYEENMISLRRNVITEVMEVHSQSFPSLKTFEFVIDPEELKYPIDKLTQRTLYNVVDIAACVKSGKDFVNSERDSRDNKVLKQISIRELLTNESTTTDITQLSILQGRDLKKLTSNHGADYVSNEEYTENEDCSLDIADTQGSVNETGTIHVVDGVMEDSRDIEHLTDLRKAVTSPVVKKQETTVSSSYKDKLDISDLDDIISFLKCNQFANHQWQELGLQLGLYKPTLEDIDDKCRGDPRKCLRECLAAWLKGEDKVMDKGGPSWTPLADVLHVIGEHNIAICINSRQ